MKAKYFQHKESQYWNQPDFFAIIITIVTTKSKQWVIASFRTTTLNWTKYAKNTYLLAHGLLSTISMCQQHLHQQWSTPALYFEGRYRGLITSRICTQTLCAKVCCNGCTTSLSNKGDIGGGRTIAACRDLNIETYGDRKSNEFEIDGILCSRWGLISCKWPRLQVSSWHLDMGLLQRAQAQLL